MVGTPKKASRKAAAATDEGALVVTAQQSRFHVDASEMPTTREIDVKDLTIVIGGKEILAHANLKLQEDYHYVLVGRNGTGKSTLMRALGEGRIPGVSWRLRMLLLGQTSIVNREDDIDAQLMSLDIQDSKPKTVLEHVLTSDKRRERSLKEAKLLSDALEKSGDPLAVVKTVRKLKHQHLERHLAEARQIAARRSGARGAQARKDLIAAELSVSASQLLLQQEDSEIDATAMQEETTSAVEMLAELELSLENMSSFNADHRAKQILTGLGFSEEKLSAPFTSLSGGWQTRCSLACALFQPSDILLLDECTNFLDLPAVLWLQSYIQSLTNTTVVVITHDRAFADAVCDELLILREKGLEYFRGNLSTFESEKRKKIKHLTKMQENLDKRNAHMEESIAHNLAAAKRTGDDKKLKQAMSRKKKIEERSGIEVSAKGTRFKLNRDLPGYHLTSRAAIDIPTFDPPPKISFPNEPTPLRFPGALISFENVTFAYPGTSKRLPPILQDVTVVIHPGERVGLCGLNGSGKSTFVQLAVGVASAIVEDAPTASSSSSSAAATAAAAPSSLTAATLAELKPQRGTITRHPRARIAHFTQHSIDLLTLAGAADPSITALSHFMAYTSLLEPDARKILGSLGLSGRVTSDVPLASLSGGQKVRLALAKCVWDPPHLLVLDEVTTHLDSDTITALIEALRDYRGALLVVTHDRFFMRCVVEGENMRDFADVEEDDGESSSEDEREWTAPKGRVYRIVKGKLKELEGGMRRYEELAEKVAAKAGVGVGVVGV